MIQNLTPSRYAHLASKFVIWTQAWLIPLLLRHRVFGAALIASLLAIFYWGIIASNRYVSEAHVIIQKTDITSGQSMDFGNLLGGGGGGGRTDQLLLRDYLLSVEILKKLDDKLHLRAHYSDWHYDPVSRMWFESTSMEQFHLHFLSRVSVEYDDYAGVLVIKTQAYDPKVAQAIAATMVEEGERHMNAMAHGLAQDQVSFLEKQVADMSSRAIQARQALLNFQNRKGMVSPQGTAENLAAIINTLQAKLTDLQTQRSALQDYLMPDSANLTVINQQISAVKNQIRQEQARLVSPNGKTLNNTVEEYQRLQMNADFALDIYKTALTALERGRVEASRNLKKVSLLQSPTEPQYPLEPRRLYNMVVFILVALLCAGIIHLLSAIVRDHKD